MESLMPPALWAFASIMIAVSSLAIGIRLVCFLRKNVIRLPRSSKFRAWAGIREENGRTYPYSLRLALKCPKCHDKKMKFKMVPSSWVDFYDTKTRRRTGRHVQDWEPVALCTRNKEHSLLVDISDNDFDKPLKRLEK